MVRLDGEVLWVRTRAYPMLDGEGQMVRIAGVTKNITAERELHQALQRAAEIEKITLGNDIHDTVCQDLLGISSHCSALARLTASLDPHLAEVAQQAADMAASAGEDARQFANGLSPLLPERETLPRALREFVDTKQERHPDVELSLSCPETGPLAELETVFATQVYFIAREAMRNALAHAEPTQVTTDLRANDPFLELTVTDNGNGRAETIDREAGLGLRSMCYRATQLGGTFKLRNNPEGSGLQIYCRIPLLQQTSEKS